MRGRLLASVVMTLALAGLALPAAGEAYVYWANYDTGTISRADLAGTEPEPNFITTVVGPSGVAVDGSHVYWTNQTTGMIGRANLDGSNPNPSFITGAHNPFGVAVDDSHVYWANYAGDTIGRANLNGTDVNQSFITGASFPFGVAVDGSHVYWTNRDTDTIGRANLEGKNPEQSFITGASDPVGVAVDGSHVYWTNDTTGTIGRANLDGKEVEQSFITGASVPTGVAVDGSHIYWTNVTTNTIGRANLDGKDDNQGFITNADRPLGVAVDALPPDATAPVVSCGQADGRWHADNVSIACTASDDEPGLADPAQASFSLTTNVPADSEDANAPTNSVEVCDLAGNCTTAGPITGNKIDRKAPVVACGQADGRWHADNVSIACTASDAGSGLADSSQASFSLRTSVPAGTEDADAATTSVEVCDRAGNCTTAGPITGIKIDRKAPQVTLTSPRDGATYSALATLLDPVRASYSCSDTGSGVASCSGTRPDGAVIDTSPLALGSHTFTVTATDQVGHKTTVTHSYQVTL